jgi:hypothetical protein
MSKTRILLPMIFWAVLVAGASFGSQSAQAQERTSSQSGEKSAKDSSPDGSKTTQARGQKDQMGEYLVENGKGFAASKRGTPKRRPAASHAKLAPSRQLSSGKTRAANNLQTETPRNALDSHQTGSTMPSQVPNKPLKHSSMTVSPQTVALNGQQFKNSRDPGARMAISGGSANSTRGTAVINGSDIKRKP